MSTSNTKNNGETIPVGSAAETIERLFGTAWHLQKKKIIKTNLQKIFRSLKLKSLRRQIDLPLAIIHLKAKTQINCFFSWLQIKTKGKKNKNSKKQWDKKNELTKQPSLTYIRAKQKLRFVEKW